MAKETKPVAKKASVGDIRDLVASDMYKKQFAMALPKHLKPERFIRIALTALTKTPKLMQCTQASLMSCLLDLSQLGLEPDGRRAHLIPYQNKKTGNLICTLIVDYKGLVELVMNTGQVSNIHADIICEKDTFVYNTGIVEKHAIDFRSPRGTMYAAYCVITMKDGTKKAEVMPKEEIDSIRARSKAKDSGPWVTDYNEMAKKTVFRRASKWVKLSPEQKEALEKDDAYQFDVRPPIDVTPGKPEVAQPQPRDPKKENAYKNMLEEFAKAKSILGDFAYYAILNKHGFKKSSEIRDMKMGSIILEEMIATNPEG